MLCTLKPPQSYRIEQCTLLKPLPIILVQSGFDGLCQYKWSFHHHYGLLTYQAMYPVWYVVFQTLPEEFSALSSEYCSPGIDSASNRNDHREYFLERCGGRCVGLTALPPPCADCLEIWEPQPPGTLRACPWFYGDCSSCAFYPQTSSDMQFDSEEINVFRTVRKM